MAIDTLPGSSAGITAAGIAAAAAPEPVMAAPDRRMALARAIVRYLERALPEGAGVSIVLDEATATGGVAVPGPTVDVPTPAQAGWPQVRLKGPDAVGRLALGLTHNALAEGFLRGDLDVVGDLSAAIDAARSMDVRRLAPADVRRVARYALELRRNGTNAPAPRRPARLSGRRHSLARDLEAVRFHYDVGEDFYTLWLDRRLTYSCAYFDRPDDPAGDLDAAQEAKLDLVCRKLDLHPGQRLLDIGCGWGSLVLFAAERYGVHAVGVTLSERQADEANRRAALMGLERSARAEILDYRALGSLGSFDAVASVGMFEHVGRSNLATYFRAAYEALTPGGRFLNHGIATNERRPRWLAPPQRRGFNDRYVFPDGELVPVDHAVAVACGEAGFELLDVQSLRPHYALTLRAWVERLERSWDPAVAAAGEEVARTWRLYMSGARVGFERGEIDVTQLLLSRPAADGRPASRPLRPWW